jgi:hypothetical protein
VTAEQFMSSDRKYDEAMCVSIQNTERREGSASQHLRTELAKKKESDVAHQIPSRGKIKFSRHRSIAHRAGTTTLHRFSSSSSPPFRGTRSTPHDLGSPD